MTDTVDTGDAGEAPDPLRVVPPAANSPASGRKTVERAVRQLLSKHKIDRAESVLVERVADADRASSWVLALHAEIIDARNKYRTSVDLWRRAYEADKTNVHAASEYILTLAFIDCFRLALSVYSKMSSKVRKSKPVRESMLSLYVWIGWTAHANQLRRKLGLASHPTRWRRTIRFLRRPIEPLLLSIERHQRARLLVSMQTYEYLQQPNYRTDEQRFDTYAEVDLAMLQLARINSWRKVLGDVLEWLFPLAAAVAMFIYGWLTAVTGPDLLHIIGVPLVGFASYLLGMMLIVRIRSYLYSILTVLGLSFASVIFGLSLRADSAAFPFSVRYTGATGLIGAGALMAGMVVSLLIVNGLRDFQLRRARNRHARGVLIDLLIDALIGLDNIPMSHGSSSGRSHFSRFESAATFLERGIPAQARAGELATDTWITGRCSRGAVAIRAAKQQALSGGRNYWAISVRRTLLQALSSACTENWSALPQRSELDQPVTSKAARWRAVGKAILVAFLPAIALAVASPWLRLSADATSWAQIVALGWAVIGLLFALDPGIREKIDTARDVADSLRGITGGTDSSKSSSPPL